MVHRLFRNDADQNVYALLVQLSAAEEGLVNGIWSTILSAWFPAHSLNWSINPEYRGGAGPMDLVVIRNEIGRNAARELQIRHARTVIFEGKGSNGENYERIYTQLVDYARASDERFVYLIGARGGTCCFWRFTRAQAENEAEKMVVDKHGVVRFAYRGLNEYDIVTEQGQIARMLQWIVQHLPPVPGR